MKKLGKIGRERDRNNKKTNKKIKNKKKIR